MVLIPFFQTLALGGLLVALVYAALMAFFSREKHFLFLCMLLSGELLREAARGGFALGHVGLFAEGGRAEQGAALGALIATLGFVGVFYTLVPGLRQQRLLFAVFAFLVISTILTQLAALLWAYPMALQVGRVLVYELLLVGLCMTGVAWRQGQRYAGILLLCGGLLWFPEALRLATALEILPAAEVEYVNAVWAVMLVIPVLLAGLSRHARGIESLLDAEQAANRAKVELIARMGHELRTPLDTILGNAQLLERRTSDAYAVEGLQHIQHSGRHLLHMVDEVLDYARGLAGKLPLHIEPVEWGVWVRQMEHSGHVLASQSGNTFAVALEGVTEHALAFDAHRLQQVLDNLIANAARHTHGGWIRMDCSQSDGWLHFGVSDNGDGIEPQDLERIFLPFERGSRTGRGERRSIGMGLAIARQLVRSMGGELTVQSTPGKGTRFTFRVQTQPVAAARIAPPSAAPAFSGWHFQGPSRSVLVVASNPENRALLTCLLQAMGFLVLEASDGTAAIGVLRGSTVVDLVITELSLAGGDGWMVLQHASSLQPPVPVILVFAEMVHRPKDLEAGIHFAVQLQKPLDHAELLQAVTFAMGLQWIRNPVPQTLTAVPGYGARSVDVRPPASELQMLNGLIESGQVSEILLWASALQLAHPEYAPFVQAVSGAARDLDFPALRALTDTN